MNNKDLSAETKADSTTKDDVTTSSQTIANALVVGSFYRYETVEYAELDYYGDFVSPAIPNPKVELRTYNLFKETEKGFWIGCGKPDGINSPLKWVSKTATKRFAYPTKEEALENFIKRNERRIQILKRQSWCCEIAVSIAKNMKCQ